MKPKILAQSIFYATGVLLAIAVVIFVGNLLIIRFGPDVFFGGISGLLVFAGITGFIYSQLDRNQRFKDLYS